MLTSFQITESLFFSCSAIIALSPCTLQGCGSRERGQALLVKSSSPCDQLPGDVLVEKLPHLCLLYRSSLQQYLPHGLQWQVRETKRKASFFWLKEVGRSGGTRLTNQTNINLPSILAVLCWRAVGGSSTMPLPRISFAEWCLSFALRERFEKLSSLHLDSCILILLGELGVGLE